MMRAIQVNKYGQTLKMMDYEIPKAQTGQFLIKVLYAPIHPADVYFYKGIYGIRNPLPSPIGFEGVGIVEGADDQTIRGQIVSFIPSKSSKFGSWSQYCVVDRSDCIKVMDQRHTSQSQKYSCAFINPFTALGFLEIVRKGAFKNILFSSCQSSVSQISLRMFNKYQPQSKLYAMSRDSRVKDNLNFVDKIFQINDIEDQIINQFDVKGPVAYFDSLGGPLAGKILHSLPKNSKLISYGSSSMQHIGYLNPQDLIFQGKTLEGFWMNSFYDNLESTRRIELMALIQQELAVGSIFDSKIAKIFKLADIEEALQEQKKLLGGGKILLDMSD